MQIESFLAFLFVGIGGMQILDFVILGYHIKSQHNVHKALSV